MALNTYSDLIAGIQAWVEDTTTDLTDEINDLVDLAEKRLVRDLDLAIFRRTDSTVTLSIGTATATKATIASPDLRVATKSIWLSGGGLTKPVFLQRRSHEYIQFLNAGAANGTPAYWGENDEGGLIFAAPPDATYTVNERYLSRPEPLSTSNESNWLSDNAYDLLFKAAMAETEAFLKNDQRKSIWDMDYEAALPAARRELAAMIANQYGNLAASPMPGTPRN